jgi:TonB family protein|nr:energy transducer TonB [uncultured Pedobacter sp.]
MKKLITLNLLLLTVFAFAQKKQNVYYLDKEGKTVANKDNSDLIRIIQEPDSGSVNYILKEFYPDGSKKRLGTVSKFSPYLVLEGPVTEFYENGKRKKFEHYSKNKAVGDAYYFYENGKIQEQRLYLPKPIENASYKTLQYADSTGKLFLDDNGTGKVEITSGSKIVFAGSFINGLKDGEWKEYIPEEKSTHNEIYENGKFIKGTNTMDDGNVIEYDKFETLPTFKGGVEAFGRFLSRNLHYPPDARDNNTQGRVYLQFVIEKDGSLTEAKVIRGIGGGCDEEALRVIKLSPKWNPGVQRGVAKRVSYTIPIFFKLSGPPKTVSPYQKPYGTF